MDPQLVPVYHVSYEMVANIFVRGPMCLLKDVHTNTNLLLKILFSMEGTTFDWIDALSFNLLTETVSNASSLVSISYCCLSLFGKSILNIFCTHSH